MSSIAIKQIFHSAFNGSLVADAVAMPVHWYYDTSALDRDYGPITGYQKPRNPHAGSILWRSAYTPVNERGDILREQAQYWGLCWGRYMGSVKNGQRG